jgi:hypothetical protein
MPSDWIGELAEAARTNDQLLLMREHSRAQEAQAIAAKSQCFWDGQVDTVEADVGRFQREFADDPKRSVTLERIGPGGFRVLRPSSPGVSLDVQLKLCARAIEFKFSAGAGGNQGASGWSGTLAMRVNTGGDVYLNQYGRDFMNFEELSRMFLERVFKGTFR